MLSARIWRERGPRYRNEAARCTECGKMHFPPRRVCLECGHRELEACRMTDTGKVVTYTVIRVAPPGFGGHVPYVVAVLEMDDSTRIMAQVVDVVPADMRTGMEVRLQFRKIRQQGRSGVISYAHKAVPV